MSSPNKVYSYLLKNYGEDVYLDITAFVGEKARGGEELNQLPESIKFTVDDPEDLNGDRIDIASDSEIVICKDNSYTEVIGIGIVEDPGRQLLSWDWINDRPIYRYNLSIEQKDFSDDPIDAVSYTNTLLSDILDDLFLYSDDSLGGIDLDKYYLNIPDFTVNAFTFEKGTLREAITALCKQLRLKWVITDYVQPDSTNLIATKRTIDFFDASGLQPVGQNSSWSSGINDDSIKFGTVTNPYDPLADEMPGDYDFEPAEDRTVIVNHLEIEANIYTGNDTETLHRWTEEAKPNTVVYNLDGIAAEVVYVGFLIQSYCLDGSTDTIIRIPSKHSPTIAAGNIARIINAVDDITDTIEEFIEVDSVNVVNTDYTEITLIQALSFTPSANYIFEIVGNVTIVDDNQETYASTGVAIELSKGQDARLRFLDLSEPPPGVTIVCYYKKVQPFRIVAKHGDSKLRYGTKYKYKKLDDDVVTTREELQNIANSALIPYPNYILNFKSTRPEKLKVGTSLPVNVVTFEDKNYICTKASWEDLGGLDENREPVVRQEITLMTVVENTDSILNNFEQAKKTTVTSEKKDLFFQNEQIKLIDNITFSLSVSAISYTQCFSTTGGNLYVSNDNFTDVLLIESGLYGVELSYNPVLNKIFYSKLVSGVAQVFSINPDGTTITQITSGGTAHRYLTGISPDGTKIAYLKAGNGIYYANIDGTGETYVTGSSASYSEFPLFNDNGTYIIYAYSNFPTYAINKYKISDTTTTTISSTLGATYPDRLTDSLIAYRINSGGVDQIAINNINGSSETVKTASAFDKLYPNWINSDNFYFIRNSNKALYKYNISGNTETLINNSYSFGYIEYFNV